MKLKISICKKVAFASKYEADKHIYRLCNKSTKRGSIMPIRSYECEKCNTFHLTSKGSLEELTLIFIKFQKQSQPLPAKTTNILDQKNNQIENLKEKLRKCQENVHEYKKRISKIHAANNPEMKKEKIIDSFFEIFKEKSNISHFIKIKQLCEDKIENFKK